MAALTGFTTSERIIRHAHVFCGIGMGAKGFNMAKARVGNVVAKFVCTGGIDVDAGAIRNFQRVTGTPGTVMDLFSREQYIDFHGHEPPAEWREATPEDVRAALTQADGTRPDVVFLSAPCKGFSGLLSSKQSGTDKYQALNGLTVRGVWLICEAFKDGPIPVILFENVPRILTRGRFLLDQIAAILRSYNYNVAETVHDCGVLGGLAQSRKRMLLIARQREIIPNFIYEPEKKRLRGVGEVIGKLPLPGDPAAGIMHRVPMLQWKTWLRLALVPAGRDWRALNDLAVVDGVLRDYGIVPDQALRDDALGVLRWEDTSGTIIGNQRSPLHGRHSVADPRYSARDRSSTLGVRAWDQSAGTVQGESYPTNGSFSVADPRVESAHNEMLGVRGWQDPARVVAGSSRPANGAHSVADPRVDGHPKSVQLGVRAWDKPAACVKGDVSVGTGPYAVSDPRIPGKPRFNNIFRIVPFDQAAFAVADPRGGSDPSKLFGNRHVDSWDGPSRSVIANAKNGASAVADPRPACLNADGRQGYATQGHYGVVDWTEHSGAIPAFAKNNNGPWSVADPREAAPEPLEALPGPDDRIVARIIALDGTWHRPFTTLDLSALQSLIDPEEVFYCDADGWHARMPFELDSKSDAEKREWIGNGVPSESAAKVGSVIGEAILLAELGETFTLSAKTIWVAPARLALAVDQHQAALEWEARGC
ncbi:DNA cytosine methyltransferase [Sphingomonas koreensis]|uniref:DNA cytosine methyltransferase n=1 Tax=Sphingomonas koreensis TaxID=93064 RepID=A0A430G2E8_9SPHN|nr:DNA cytosine methyltransferase [Sphingomonas koreensis]RSY83146.1 DNA cytosine methyltransferase [Sphingomonas koreensis]